MEKQAITQLSTLGHEHRMAVFRLLMRRYPDGVPAGEVGRALDLKPSTTSVYLSALMDAGLITQRREGTSLMYRVDMAAADRLMRHMFFDCCRGRPDLCLPDSGEQDHRLFNVLFVCTGNSARSIMAETLLRNIAGDRFVAHSAGSNPYCALNPFTIELLKSKGHDIAPLRSKHIAEFQTAEAPPMDFVFTVCDHAANEECPTWAGQPISAHWGLPDPVAATGTDAERALAFQETYAALKSRLSAFAALPFDSLDRIGLQRAVDDLAT